MNRVKIKYLRSMAIAAILATSLIPSMRTSTAESQPSPVATAVAGADLASEERVIAKYFDDLIAHDKQTAELGKRARFVNADIEPLQRKSDDLKGRLSGVQNSIREIVRKLKAANEWDNLDSFVVISDARERSIFKETSFKKLLEESSNNLTSNASEISAPLENLRKRLTSRYSDGADVQFVRATYRETYEAPAPVAFYSVRCSLGQVRLKLIKKLGGYASNPTLQTVFESCHDPGTASPF
jgi:chaperonin cofactor prefoldin